MPFRISVDADKCIGCGACTHSCDNLRIQGNAAVPISPEVDEVGCNEDAAHGCPTQAITVDEV